MTDLNKDFSDKRNYVRVNWSQEIICHTIYNVNEEKPVQLQDPIYLASTNISIGGLSLICDISVEVGSILSFNILIDSISYEVNAKVVYCLEYNDVYVIGAEFINPSDKLVAHIRRLVARLSLIDPKKK